MPASSRRFGLLKNLRVREEYLQNKSEAHLVSLVDWDTGLTGTSGAEGKLAKKRMDLEAALQKWVTAGSDFVAPKEPDGKSATAFRAWLTGMSLGIRCMHADSTIQFAASQT